MRGDAPRTAERHGRPIVSARTLWLFPPIYAVHLLDERFFGEGTAVWATTHLGVHLTNDAWLVINAAWLVLLVAATWLVWRGTWPTWVTIVLATHLAVHSLGRVWGSLFFPGWSPGVVSGLALGLPWAVPVLVRGLQRLPLRELALGVLVGILSLQPVWDFAMLPVLSPRSAP